MLARSFLTKVLNFSKSSRSVFFGMLMVGGIVFANKTSVLLQKSTFSLKTLQNTKNARYVKNACLKEDTSRGRSAEHAGVPTRRAPTWPL